MFLTDGALERAAAKLDMEALVAAGAEMHPREAVQHLVRALLEPRLPPALFYNLILSARKPR
jgi:hypothetical protein